MAARKYATAEEAREAQRQRSAAHYRANRPSYIKRSKAYYELLTPLQLREKDLRRKYGIGLKEYDELLARQGGVCAVCGEPPSDELLVVDHDHVTGKVRGLLHRKCNSAIGFLKDSLEMARRVVQYLEAAHGA